ncbi:mitochondrial fission ELM1 family protein [Tistrella mobilis]|uniref:mitochondrial fission ELM1 family protein n=1 Tax=Tistrella mobilis TaxID=171437 RepID=UPI0035588A34
MTDPRNTGQPQPQPHVCVLTDDRAGNNSQALGVAEALGWPITEIRLSYTRLVRLPNLIRGTTTLGLSTSAAAALDAVAAPDIAIAAGRRATPALRRLKRRFPQMIAVQIMWPGEPSRGLDLIAVPAHDRIARESDRDPRLLVTLGAPNRVTPARLAEAAGSWEPRFAAAGMGAGKAPRIGLLVGGTTKRMPFGPEDARHLARLVADLAARHDARILATNSRRSGAEVTAALSDVFQATRPGAFWLHDVAMGGDNPYFGILGVADLIVVTGDSMSMASEAASTGRPVAILPITGEASKEARLHRALYALGAARPLDADFVARGEIAWRYPPLDDAQAVAAQIRRLVLANPAVSR